MERSASINADPPRQPGSHGSCGRWRNWVGFWLLGLCNNFAYVVMLSAAHDILEKQESQNSTTSAPPELVGNVPSGNKSNSSGYDCSPVSTGAVLLADILPTLIIKLFTPFMIHVVPYGFRVLFCVAMAATSFLLVSFSSAVWMSIVGVIFASISAGLGELSFLSLSVFFDRNVLEGWGSGTGAAGVAGSLLYSGLIQAGVSPQITLLIMLVVPLVMFASYFYLLTPVPSLPQWRRSETEHPAEDSPEQERLIKESEDEERETSASGECPKLTAACVAPKGRISRNVGRCCNASSLISFSSLFRVMF